MDAGDLISSFATGTYTVTRRVAPSFVKGRVTQGSTSTLAIAASVQPATGRDLLRLPEGRRALETRVLFTSTQLLVGGQGSSNDADLVAIDGNTWEVQHVESWLQGSSDSGFYRCVVQAYQGGAGGTG